MKMKFKALALSLAVAAGTTLPVVTNAGGIPVIDVGNIAQAVIQVQKLQGQIQNQINQIQQLEREFQSITGTRNLGKLIIDKSIKTNLPKGYRDYYDALKTGNVDAVFKAELEKILQEQADVVENKTADKRLKSHDANSKASMLSMLQQQLDRVSGIAQIAQQIDFANDPKAAQDLANRIGIEQALVTAEQGRINMMIQINEQNRRIVERQASQQYTEHLAKRSSLRDGWR